MTDTNRCVDCGTPLLDVETGPRCFPHTIKHLALARAMDEVCAEINEQIRRMQDDQS
jgi:hypothetical protein